MPETRYYILAPKLVNNSDRIRIGEWRVREGETIQEGALLVIADTDKAAFEVEAEASGTIVKLLRQPKEECRVMEPIAEIALPDGAPAPLSNMMIPTAVYAPPETPDAALPPPPTYDEKRERLLRRIERTDPPRPCDGRVVIIGAASTGEQILEVFQREGTWKVVAFVDGDPANHGRTIGGVPVAGGIAVLPTFYTPYYFIAIAHSRARAKINKALRRRGYIPVNAIHPRADISPTAQLGAGIVVEAGTCIGWQAVIGDNCKIDMGCIIEHHCIVSHDVHLAPGVHLGGKVLIGNGSLLGIGTSVASLTEVGRNAMTDVGAAVVQDAPADSILSGVPARPIGERKRDWPALLDQTIEQIAALPRRGGANA